MIVSFAFDKILVEKKKPARGNIQVNNVVNITKLDETTLPIRDKKALKVNFDFIVKYEPGVADIVIKGFLVYLAEDIKAILKGWKEKKKIENVEVNSAIINAVFMKCNMKALQLAENMNLPLPVKMPRIVAKDKDAKEASEASYVG